MGDKFNLKQFHENFLSYGSAPVKYIRKMMLAELESEKEKTIWTREKPIIFGRRSMIVTKTKRGTLKVVHYGKRLPTLILNGALKLVVVPARIRNGWWRMEKTSLRLICPRRCWKEQEPRFLQLMCNSGRPTLTCHGILRRDDMISLLLVLYWNTLKTWITFFMK